MLSKKTATRNKIKKGTKKHPVRIKETNKPEIRKYDSLQYRFSVSMRHMKTDFQF